ncbi:MFS transporter [Subtercola sp. PAMC28395]|uniref:MFS transporter n=1 Tax=Subtercola sp. PAMC28395 TaxID=2846775 RepID=UPI001C0D1087|nr:MFS transporter [Subtercola sp. PAMC28395]QWT22696.1 MFS transporter [Subtercola sp. PAMC28395]
MSAADPPESAPSASPAPYDSAPATGFKRGPVILLGLLGAIQVADPLISSLALVKASDELHFSASVQSLAAGISTLALAATVIPGGLLADRLGRRNVLLVSILVASVGQLLTAVSPDAATYLLGRVIAGVALGVTFGAAYGMLREVSSPTAMGPAMALFNVVNGILPIVAMVLTGVLVAVNWRLAYLILPVVSVICFPFIPAILPKVRRLAGGSVDIAGLTLLAAGVAGVLFGLSNANAGVGHPTFWLPILIGIIGFAGFAIVENRVAAPVFPVRLLAHPAFLGAVIMGVFWNFAAAGMSQMLPNLFQYVTHLPTGVLGLASLPMSLAGIAGSIAAGAAFGKGVLPRTMALVGYGLMVVGFLSFLLVTPTAGYIIFVPGMLLAGAGWMMNATSQGNLFISLAPAKFYGPVTSSKVTVGQFGYALGLTGTTVLVSMFTLRGVDSATNGAVTGEGNWNDITAYLESGTTTNTALQSVSPADMAAIYTHAFQSTSVIVAVVVAIAGVLMFLSLRSKKAGIPVDDFLAQPVQTSPPQKGQS